MTNQHLPAIIAGHRTAAHLLEQHPDIALPHVGHDSTILWSLYNFECPGGVGPMVAAIRRAVGGTWEKREQQSYRGDEMVFERDGYRIRVEREQVCVRRVVGTETVTIPAQPAREAQPERTEERELVEWDCQPILGEQVPA